MVHGQKQRVLGLSHLDEPAADEWPGLEIEGRTRLLLTQALQIVRRVQVMAQVVILEREADIGSRDVLRGFALWRGEGGAQRFVAFDDSRQRTL
jgi:hypothetical protein